MNAPWRRQHLLVDAVCFDPGTILLSVASAVSAVGQISAGAAQANAAKYNAEVDQNNAVQAQQAADQQSVASQQQTQSKVALQKVDYAASGVDVGTGSPLDVMNDTITKGKLDAMTLRYGGQVTSLRDQEMGTLATYQGAQAQEASDIGAAGTLLTGAGKAVSAKWPTW